MWFQPMCQFFTHLCCVKEWSIIKHYYPYFLKAADTLNWGLAISPHWAHSLASVSHTTPCDRDSLSERALWMAVWPFKWRHKKWNGNLLPQKKPSSGKCESFNIFTIHVMKFKWHENDGLTLVYFFIFPWYWGFHFGMESSLLAGAECLFMSEETTSLVLVHRISGLVHIQTGIQESFNHLL